MFYAMRGMEFADQCPPYWGSSLLDAINEFVRHVRGPQSGNNDIVAVVEICRECAGEASSTGCLAPWIYLRTPHGSSGHRSRIMALPRSRSLDARQTLTGMPDEFPIWHLQDAQMSVTGDAVLRDGTRLFDLHLKPDPLFQSELWSALDRDIISEVAAFLGVVDPGTRPELLSKLARRVAATKLEALLAHLKARLPKTGSEETIRKQLVRIGLHRPTRTTKKG